MRRDGSSLGYPHTLPRPHLTPFSRSLCSFHCQGCGAYLYFKIAADKIGDETDDTVDAAKTANAPSGCLPAVITRCWSGGGTPEKKWDDMTTQDKLYLSAKESGFLPWRVFDFCTDWGFVKLSVDTPRFQYVMAQEGYDFDAFYNAVLTFAILGSLLVLPECYAHVMKTKVCSSVRAVAPTRALFASVELVQPPPAPVASLVFATCHDERI